jgi:phage shock protein C
MNRHAASGALNARIESMGSGSSEWLRRTKSNNSFNRSGISLDFIENLNVTADASRPVNSGVRWLQFCDSIQFIGGESMRLTKSSDRVLSGVCGGIAEWLGWSPRAIRYLFIFASFFSLGLGGLVIYTVLAIMMPPPSDGFNLQDYRKQ